MYQQARHLVALKLVLHFVGHVGRSRIPAKITVVIVVLEAIVVTDFSTLEWLRAKKRQSNDLRGLKPIKAASTREGEPLAPITAHALSA